LSDAAGDGCSGSPLMFKPAPRLVPVAPSAQWSLIGVYVGERVASADKTLKELFPGAAKSRGYAVRIDAVADWEPDLLEGRSLREEAQT